VQLKQRLLDLIWSGADDCELARLFPNDNESIDEAAKRIAEKP